jgi:uncharacterized UBP type Zn finger protein
MTNRSWLRLVGVVVSRKARSVRTLTPSHDRWGGRHSWICPLVCCWRKTGVSCNTEAAAVQNLDFDFEKCCSVSLSPVNVYACLVCGKYFQGRGPQTHAYTHALEVGHQMYMKLDTGKVSI